MWKSSLCDYRDVHKLIRATISVANMAATVANNADTKVI